MFDSSFGLMGAQASSGKNQDKEGRFDNGGRTKSHVWGLDMSVFDGTDPDGWIFKVERYFIINRLTEKEKWDAAAMCLDGDALAWF